MAFRRLGIIDYRLCNLDSILRALQICGGEPVVSSNPRELAGSDLLILPGVGAFGPAMQNLRSQGMASFIQDAVAGGTPLLGICLGMQLLASGSEEGGDFEGLSLIPGHVVALRPQDGHERVPHMGWNSVEQTIDGPMFQNIPASSDFYFVHGYHVVCDERYVLARTGFAGGINAAVQRGAVMGTQFHPEKSQAVGMQLLRNVLSGAVGEMALSAAAAGRDA